MNLLRSAKKLNHLVGSTLHIPHGQDAFILSASLCMVVAVTWIIVILAGLSWHRQDSFLWSFSLSLSHFGATMNSYVDQAEQDHAVTRLSRLFDTMIMRDPIWISVARYEFCRQGSGEGLSADWCQWFRRLMMASWLVGALGIFGVCCLLMGVTTGFVFHFIKPRSDLQWWCAANLICACVVLPTGVFQYYLQTNDFGHLVGEHGDTFGVAFYLALVSSLLLWIPTWVMISFAFSSSWDEENDEERPWGEADAKGKYGTMIMRGTTSVKTAFTSMLRTVAQPGASDEDSEENPDQEDAEAAQWESGFRPGRPLSSVGEVEVEVEVEAELESSHSGAPSEPEPDDGLRMSALLLSESLPKESPSVSGPPFGDSDVDSF